MTFSTNAGITSKSTSLPSAQLAIKKGNYGRKKIAAPENDFADAKEYPFVCFLEDYLPLCKDEWDHIYKEYSKVFSQQGRTVENFR